MRKVPSRILNEKPGFLGLTVLDFAVLGYFLILTHGVLSEIGFELLAFPLSGLFAVLLIGVRLRHRPKVIRDFFLFKATSHIFCKQRSL